MKIRVQTLRDGFAYYGAVAVNSRWAWSALSPDGRTVVLTLWEDKVYREGNTLKVNAFGDSVHLWKDTPGNRDRIKKLVHARDNCGGLFRAVFVVAKDTKVIPRSIASRYVDPTLQMKLVDLNEETGEFYAESLETS